MRRFPIWLFAAASVCFGQTNSPWRFWDSGDGLPESYASGVAAGPNGSVWVKHGVGIPVNLLNGYASHDYGDPGGIGKIETAPDGTLWLWSGNQLKRFLDSTWTTYQVDAVTALGTLHTNSFETWVFTSNRAGEFQATLMLVPLDSNRVLIMLPDRILEFDAASSQAHPVLTLQQTSLTRFAGFRAAGGNTTIYLSGRGGVGRVSQNGSGAWQWQALPAPPSPYVALEELSVWGAGVLATGVTSASATAVLGFDGLAWRVLYKAASRVVRAWPGVGASIWIQDGDHVFEVAGGRTVVAERNAALSGILLSEMTEAPGRFWITSSQGLAHYMPPLWQTPPEAPPVDDVVNAIIEDHTGRIWFLAAHNLVCLDGTKWSSFPLPKGEMPWAVLTDGLALLADGSLAIRTTAPTLLIFDPVLHSFHVIAHPEGRRLRMSLSRPDGTMLIETIGGGSHAEGAIESFDGHTFRHFLRLPSPWNSFELRTIQVASTGEVWAGGMDFLGSNRGSQFRAYTVKDGFGDPGAYYVHLAPSGRVFAGGRAGLYEREGEKWRLVQSGLDRVRNVITARDGSLWVASGNGVHRYREGIWISNGFEEGLPSSVAYKIFEDSRGRIWAGTTRGISLFHPEADADAPMALLAANQNPREAPPAGQIRLVFSGVDKWKFTLTARLLFSYRLDGGAWSSFASANSASFDKIPAGAHRFEVRAMDRNGNISVTPAVHQFSVLLPWYGTPGFRWSAASSGLLIVVLLTLAFLSYSHRGRLILELNQKAQLERDSQEILQMIAAREPLPAILRRIAASAARECPGAACVVFHDTGQALDFFAFPKLPEALVEPVCRLAQDQWWPELCSIARGYLTGNCPVAAVRSGEKELLGAIVLFADCPDRGPWLETFADLAAAAIENVRLYERLEHQARHDTLTGLPNRFFFEHRLQASVSSAKAQGGSVAVLYLDLDRFKQINDSLGHRVGDLFLKQVTARLTGALGHGRTLARIGGDEFTVLADANADRASVDQLASNLLAALRAPIVVEGKQLFASVSIGISFFPEDGETPSTLQKHADAAMYRAKAAGRNRVLAFSEDMVSSSAAAMNLEQLLHRALDEGLFELHYQPQFTLAGDLSGFEALLRVRDEQGEFVSPAEFIPIAEETGLIVPIGAWVLRETCRQIREWQDDGLAATKIAINVSALQIARPSFADEVSVVLSETGIDARCLEVELTESAIMGNLVESKRQMQKLRALGVGIAVDDFGTGYSSLSYLQNLPINILKIDRSFVHAITGPEGGLPMVQAILALARNLGLTVVAEGVETESQLTALRGSSCDFLQGFLFCRPQPASEARAYLSRTGFSLSPENQTCEQVA